MFFAHLVAWTFNALMLGVDILAGILILSRRSRTATCLAFAMHLIAGLILAMVLTRAPFLLMRLVSYAVFLHLPLMLLTTAFLLWRYRRRAAFITASLAGVILAVAFDAFIVEPHWLCRTYITVSTAKVTTPIRIAILADIQTDRFGSFERKALVACMAGNPDMIVMAGDYIQVATAKDWDRASHAMNDCLREIAFGAPLGVFAVRGNTDHPAWEDIFLGIDAHLFVETRDVGSDSIVVTGLNVTDSFDRHQTVSALQPFHVVVGHAPDFALGDIGGDLLIAGHTHGGQVCLPGIGPLVTATQVPRDWATGVTQLDGHRTLIVSRGIGMERLAAPRLRFFCRPELVFVDVVPKPTGDK